MAKKTPVGSLDVTPTAAEFGQIALQLRSLILEKVPAGKKRDAATLQIDSLIEITVYLGASDSTGDVTRTLLPQATTGAGKDRLSAAMKGGQ